MDIHVVKIDGVELSINLRRHKLHSPSEITEEHVRDTMKRYGWPNAEDHNLNIDFQYNNPNSKEKR